MKKLIVLLLITALVLGFAGCAPPEEVIPEAEKPAEDAGSGDAVADAPIRVGLVMTGPAQDGGYNQAAYDGLMDLESEMGFEVAYTDNIKQSDDESIIREYAQQGYDLIIGHGWEYGEALAKVAADYPDIYFAQNGGDSGGSQPNLTSGMFRTSELGYLMAKTAAQMTKTNRVGFIGAMEIPTMAAEVETIQHAVPFFNPDAKVDVIYTGSWTDVAKAKETAKVMLDMGVDVIIGINNNCDTGVIQAIEESGKEAYFIGWAADWNPVAPDIVLTSGVQSVSNLMQIVATMVKEGKFEAKAGVYGVPEDCQLLGTWSDVVPEDVRQSVIEDWEAMNSGEKTIEDFQALVGVK